MKKWYQSKTMWFNTLAQVVTILTVVLQYLDQLGLTDAQTAVLAITFNIIVTVGNQILRKVTKTGLI
ncbi:MAG: hypothetical protein COA63_014110 [Methylophaga sp.]|nr:hypothetical protein [Methylophaga sp.]